MKYRIEYADRRCCSFADSTNELIDKLQESNKEEIEDVRKVFKSGVSDSVMEIYKKYIGKGKRLGRR